FLLKEPAAGTGKNPVFGQSDIEWYHLTSDCLSCIGVELARLRIMQDRQSTRDCMQSRTYHLSLPLALFQN
ncbi:hypothetical protein OFN21_25070, partial [Escherichia coli]|nr:hypothetical protein [Escherichia coli]